jgi:hypothetical protein
MSGYKLPTNKNASLASRPEWECNTSYVRPKIGRHRRLRISCCSARVEDVTMVRLVSPSEGFPRGEALTLTACTYVPTYLHLESNNTHEM